MARMAMVAAVSAALVGVVASGAWGQFEKKGTRYNEVAAKQVSLEHVPGTALKVIAAEASVEVRFTRLDVGEVMAQARVRAQAKEGLEPVEIRAERDASGLLTVWVEGPTGDDAHAWEVERIDITMPRVSRFDIETYGGDVRVIAHNPEGASAGTLGEMPDPPLFGRWFKSLDASRISTAQGNVTLRETSGPIAVETRGGRVDIGTHVGALDVRTASGDVSAERLSEPFSVWTRSGDISVFVDPAFEGPIRTYTTSGSVYTEPAVPTGAGDAGVVASSATTASSDISIALVKD